ncbi:efflux RND transporter periplasmic adaptor subunit [soil metagenome]
MARLSAGPVSTAALRALLLGAVLFGVAACGGKKKPPPPPPPLVMAAHPLQRSIVDWDDYSGRFEAKDSVEVRPRVSGYLVAVRFTDGQMVRKGQPLFQIDPRPYQAVLDQAKANAARAQTTLDNATLEAERYVKLVAARAASQQELATRQAAAAQAKADLAAAQAQARAAALNVGFTSIIAPMAGRISDRRVAPGNLVTADTTVLTTLVTVDPIRFTFEGAEGLYLKYQRLNAEGSRASSRTRPNPVEIKLGDEAEYRWKGRMDFVDNALDTGSGTIRGRAVVANPTGFLTPGMFGHLRLLGSRSYVGQLLPDSAVATDQNRDIVLLVGPDGKVSQRVVKTGPVVDGLRVIREGLKPEDLVIVSGVQRARPGQVVKTKMMQITPPDGGPAPAPYVLPPSSSAQTAGEG